MPRDLLETKRNTFEEIENTRTTGMLLASKHVLEHRYDAAKDVFEKLLQLSPNDVEIMALHANIYCVEGKFIEAENKLNQVLILDPDYPWHYIFSDMSIMRKGNMKKQLICMRRL